VFGFNGHGRPVQVGLLHVFDFADGLDQALYRGTGPD
jgi:hypothetical protein